MTCVGLILDRCPALALVNESPSLPKGVYFRQPGEGPDRNAIVAVPQPRVARPYLSGLGMPQDILLIKRVAAVGGEVVCRSDDEVRTPDRVVRARSRDRQGVALPTWSGCRRLASDEVFLLGDTASSFDSRYFGPVHRDQIRGVYREGLTW
ncbi:MAG: S26 family signal peptidase [Alphaproteobacteria bacterium]|nr:S26 family signal peptidase [Alphaproteobacteria bacterium]MBU2163929.1 S26 family signal peptidase [Alphaproteobacteria bacterium]MBU2230373.1 S26 family signal peptidase [Alphaproteobacteria bacterium]TAJ40658.1 MAG: peptidase S26 family protein [Brevundimonas sp.]